MFLLFTVPWLAAAQDDPDDPYADPVTVLRARPAVAWKLSLFSVLDPISPSVNAGVELRFSERVGWHVEAGYANQWINPAYQIIWPRRIHGAKLVADLRLYLGGKARRFNVFLGPSIFAKYQRRFADEDLALQTGTVAQDVRTSSHRWVGSLMVKVGMFETVSQRTAVCLEPTFGVGVRILSLTDDLPPGARRVDPSMFTGQRPAGTYLLPNLMFGLAVRWPGR